MDKKAISKSLEQLNDSKISAVNALIGFDGFIDEVVHVVKERIDAENYVREATLADYGNRIRKTAGYSSNVEIVTISKKLGGNGPIMANSLMQLGVSMNYIGAIGYPGVNPVFEDMTKGCKTAIPVCQPAYTDAVEFNDGKIIRSKLSAFNELTFDNIKERVGLKKFTEYIDECNLLCFVNWALPPFSGDIWQGILDEVVPQLKNNTKDKIMFFDLADPASRTRESFEKALNTIKAFSKHYRVILGLNQSEAVQTAEVIGVAVENNLKDLCTAIMDNMQIYTVVIHPVKESCCMVNGSYFHQEGPYCENPKLSTGAGDNFNAGFLLGCVLGLDPDICLITGMANAGFYVRNARSGDFPELKDFLSKWSDNEID